MEFGRTLHSEFPPTEGWPEPVAALADELTALYDRQTAAGRRLAELVGNDTPAAHADIAARLEKADAAALVAATRAGTSTAKIRRVATEQHAADVTDARRDVLAVNAAIEAATVDLVDAMTAHRGELLAAVDALAVAGHTAFTAGVAAIDTGRRQLYGADAMRLFIDAVTTGNPWKHSRIIYDASVPRELRGTLGIVHAPSWSLMLQCLQSEAAAMEPRADDDDATDDTDDADDAAIISAA